MSKFGWKLRYQSIKRRFKTWWPLVWKKTLVNQLNQQRVRLFEEHAADLEKEHRRVDEVIGNIANLNWKIDNIGMYQLNLRFDPRAMNFGYGRHEEQQFMAKMIARQVEAEIATSKFIQKAEEARRPAFNWPPPDNPWGKRE